MHFPPAPQVQEKYAAWHYETKCFSWKDIPYVTFPLFGTTQKKKRKGNA